MTSFHSGSASRIRVSGRAFVYSLEEFDFVLIGCTSRATKAGVRLIIAGRRGSFDRERGRSVTNQEYELARDVGVPCYVFIDRNVNAMLELWQKNPTADFQALGG